ncbi:MAG: lipoprotein [Minicystis sp.]
MRRTVLILAAISFVLGCGQRGSKEHTEASASPSAP